MSLLVYNTTGSPITLAAGNPAPTIPASSNPPQYGPAFNVTGRLKGLSPGDYGALEAQRGTDLVYAWTAFPEFNIGTLTALIYGASGGAPLIPISFEPNFTPRDQVFPESNTALSKFFTGITNSQIWTFDNASGNVPEQTGNGNPLVQFGTPNYSLYTPLKFDKSKKAIGTTNGTSSGFVGNSVDLDPNNASWSWIGWVSFNTTNDQQYVINKYNGSKGWFITISGLQLHFRIKDGNGQDVTIDSVQTEYEYGQWFLLAVGWDSVAKNMILMTDLENISSNQPAMVNFNISDGDFDVMMYSDNTNVMSGALGYMAFMPGHVITRDEYNSFALHGNTDISGLIYSPIGNRGCGFIDQRDVVFGDRVNIFGKTQFPWQYINGKLSLPCEDASSNFLLWSEQLWRNGPWLQSDSPVVTAFATESPQGSITATKIDKPSAGTTPSVHQACTFVTTQVVTSVWLRADSSHTATIRLVTSGDYVSDQSLNINLTTAWQRFSINTPAYVASINTTATLYVYPVDKNTNSDTGYLYAWGAQIDGSSSLVSYVPSNVFQVSGNVGLTSFSSPVHPQQAFVEFTFIPLKSVTTDIPYVSQTAKAGAATVFIEYNQSLGVMQVILDPGNGSTALAYSMMDGRKFHNIGTRAHMLVTWDSDQQFSTIWVNGSADRPVDATISGHLISNTFNPLIQFGADFTGSNAHVNTSFEKISIGSCYPTVDQVIALANDSGVTPSRRIACMGDSITGFYNGYHAQLNKDLGIGNGKAIVIDNGVSGDTTNQMVARFTADMIGLHYTDTCILGGVNDLLFFGQNDTHVINNLTIMYQQAAANNQSVHALTITPCKGHPNWTPTIQGYIDSVNTWILSVPANVTNVTDTFSALEDPMNIDYLNPIYDSGDFLHPNALGMNVMGDAVFNQSFGGIPL